jgi:hypothetical protein
VRRTRSTARPPSGAARPRWKQIVAMPARTDAGSRRRTAETSTRARGDTVVDRLGAAQPCASNPAAPLRGPGSRREEVTFWPPIPAATLRGPSALVRAARIQSRRVRGVRRSPSGPPIRAATLRGPSALVRAARIRSRRVHGVRSSPSGASDFAQRRSVGRRLCIRAARIQSRWVCIVRRSPSGASDSAQRGSLTLARFPRQCAASSERRHSGESR